MNVYYDKDADLKIIKGKQVAIIGYGSQGHAHANNLKDSGVDVVVGLRPGSASEGKANKAGLTVQPVEDAVEGADLVMILVPDEHQARLYRETIAPNIKKGATLAFAHGFNIHFGQIEPRVDLDVIMIAPKGPGHLVRSTYTQGGGVPTLIAVHRMPAARLARSRCRMPVPTAVGAPGLSRPIFVKRPKPTCSGNRPCCVAVQPHSCRPDLKHWSMRVTPRRWPTSNVCTS